MLFVILLHRRHRERDSTPGGFTIISHPSAIPTSTTRVKMSTWDRIMDLRISSCKKKEQFDAQANIVSTTKSHSLTSYPKGGPCEVRNRKHRSRSESNLESHIQKASIVGYLLSCSLSNLYLSTVF